MKKITIRKYGARLLGDSEPIIVKSMRDQNTLWNKLVEIERANTTEYRDIVAQSDDVLAALTQEYAAAEQRLKDVQEMRNRVRAAKRSKQIEGAENYAAEIKAISSSLKDLRARMKECRARAKEAAKPRLEGLEDRRRAAVKQATNEAAIWWAHSELVTNSFDVARVKALKSNAELRFHRFEGEGRIGVRIQDGILLGNQKGTSMLQVREATPEELGHLQAQRARKRLVAVDIRVGKRGEDGHIPKATFLVTIHEGMELLPNTPLKTVTVKREMHAGQPKWFMVFMFVESDAEPEDKPLPPKAVGVDFGWRVVKDREWGERTGLRVATIANKDGTKQHITLPPELLARFERSTRLRSELDVAANEFWVRTASLFTDDILATLSEDEWLRVLVGKAKRAHRPYPSLMEAITRAHAANPVLGPEADDQMQAWARRARRLNVAAFGARRKAADHRKHLYRNVAARLVRECGLIAIKDTDFHKLAKLVDDDGKETELNKHARANRFMASPSELRQAIKMAALREQRELVNVAPAQTTTTCSACGHVHGERPKDLIFVCDSCGKWHDQDENSAAICLKIALESKL